MLAPATAMLALCLAGPALAGSPPLPTGSTSQAPEPAIELIGGITTAVPGEPAPLELTIVVPPGFKVYRDMLQVSVADAGGLSLGPASLPPGLSVPDPADPSQTRELYEFDAIVQVPVVKLPGPGTYQATFDLRYQACKGSVCLMPRTEAVTASLVVSGG